MAHLNDDGKEAGYCRFFAENLNGSALEWFTCHEGNSIDNFTQLVSVFLTQIFSVYRDKRATEADLWNLMQTPFKLLRTYINKFRDIKAKIPHMNEGVALAALKTVFGSINIQRRNCGTSSYHRGCTLSGFIFLSMKKKSSPWKNGIVQTKTTLAGNRLPPRSRLLEVNIPSRENNSPQSIPSNFNPSKYCTFHKRKRHSTEECRHALLSKKQRWGNWRKFWKGRSPSNPQGERKDESYLQQNK